LISVLGERQQMANLEHVMILKQGVEVWNTWRRENQYIHVDLSGVDLEKVHLREAYFRGVYFRGANLDGTNLRKVDLRDANLSSASLKHVDLWGADLRGANLREADLSYSDLSHTDLSGAYFKGTILYGAKLSGSTIGWATFGNIDLSNIVGLEKVYHSGPSTIGLDTFINSRGQILEVFLRGCGLSDLQIEFVKLSAPDLPPEKVSEITYKLYELYAGASIKYYSCFISYAAKDEAIAKRLYKDLQSNGVRCWFAPEKIRGGEKVFRQIDQAIRIHDKLLLVLSEDSIKSDWVAYEIKRARKRENVLNEQMLFPVRLIDYDTLENWQLFDADTVADLAAEVREYFIPDFSNWQNDDEYQKTFKRLLDNLKASSGVYGDPTIDAPPPKKDDDQ